MSPLVFTPAAADATAGAELILSNGYENLDLLGTPPWGLYLVELTIPVPARENVYVRGTEGQHRVRSTPQNASGSARVRIDRGDPLATGREISFQSDLASLQAMVESAHRYKGTLTFTPPNGERVIYDIESVQATEAPTDGARMTQFIQEFVVEFECLPWGRRESVTVFTDETFDGPIDGIEIEPVEGSVDALAVLTVSEASGADADFVEYGLIQDGYVADAPLVIYADDMNTSGFAGSQAAPGDPVVTTLVDDPTGCCGSGTQDHQGKQKIVARYQTDEEDVWMRMAWKVKRGEVSYGRWVHAAAGADDHEVTLGVVDIRDHGEWNFRVDAFEGSGSGSLALEAFYVIPAQLNGRARAVPEPDVLPIEIEWDAHALVDDGAMRFTSEGAEYQGGSSSGFSPSLFDGDVLRIPASSSSGLPTFLTLRRREFDIDDDQPSAGLSDDLSATLTIVPRDALF
jgi:hypothetical protein